LNFTIKFFQRLLQYLKTLLLTFILLGHFAFNDSIDRVVFYFCFEIHLLAEWEVILFVLESRWLWFFSVFIVKFRFRLLWGTLKNKLFSYFCWLFEWTWILYRGHLTFIFVCFLIIIFRNQFTFILICTLFLGVTTAIAI
jgi:hypothetical protein